MTSSLQSQPLKLSDRLAYWLATGFGAGLMPKAPGTFGALESVAIFILLALLRLTSQQFLISLVALDILSFLVGVWASSRTCALTGSDDPGLIVIDEINGQLIALTPLAFSISWPGVLLAFVLFRLFDIFKPFPINRMEALHGGFGVMADDTLSGVFAALPMALLVYFQFI